MVFSWGTLSFQQCYLHNILRISVYIPALRHDILELVIEKLLKIDVSIECCKLGFLYRASVVPLRKLF